MEDLEVVSAFSFLVKGKTLGLKDFIANFENLGFYFSGQILDKIYKLIAKNPNIEIGSDDFQNYFRLAKMENTDDQSQILYIFFTPCENGITYDSFKSTTFVLFKSLKAALCTYGSLEEEAIVRAFKDFDKDDDGFVNFEDFKKAIDRKDNLIEWEKLLIFGCGIQSQDKLCSYSRSAVQENIQFLIDIFGNMKRENTKASLNDDVTEIALKLRKAGSNGTTSGHREKCIENVKESVILHDGLPQHILEVFEKALQTPIASCPSIFAKSSNFFSSQTFFFTILGLNKCFSHRLLQLPLRKSLKLRTGFSISSRCYKISEENLDIFQAIREEYNINYQELLQSFSLEGEIERFIEKNFEDNLWIPSSGKSGSYFYISLDSKFIIKTLRENEYDQLQQMASLYLEYIRKNRRTFLVQFLGLYTIKDLRAYKRPFGRLLLMNNIYYSCPDSSVFYDLKGSTIGRKTENMQNNSLNSLKDLDFTSIGQKIQLSPDLKAEFLAQLLEDVNFLQSQSLIDYSLLLGISQNPIQESLYSKIYSSESGEITYTFGIIDTLSAYTMKKKIENFFKYALLGPGVTCVPPDQYAQRFLAFITSIIQ